MEKLEDKTVKSMEYLKIGYANVPTINVNTKDNIKNNIKDIEENINMILKAKMKVNIKEHQYDS